MNSKKPKKTNWRSIFRKFPEYEPPTSVWSSIQDSLDTESSFPGLPQYEPSDLVWQHIEDEIHPTTKWKFRFRQPVYRIMAAALITGTILSSSLYLWQSREQEKVKYSYQVEEAKPVLLANLNLDEAAFLSLNHWCEKHPFECAQPEVESLKAELIELTSAKAALEKQISPYDQNPGLIRQIANLEKERTRIMNSIISKI